MIGPEQSFNCALSRVRCLSIPKNQLHSNHLSGYNGSMEDLTSHYDHNMLRKRQSQLRDACIAGDLGRVIFLLRISLTRNFGQTRDPQVSVYLSSTHYNSLTAMPTFSRNTSSRSTFQKFKKPSNSWFKRKIHSFQMRTSVAY